MFCAAFCLGVRGGSYLLAGSNSLSRLPLRERHIPLKNASWLCLAVEQHLTVSASMVLVNSSVIVYPSGETVSVHTNVGMPSFFMVNSTELLSNIRTASVS